MTKTVNDKLRLEFLNIQIDSLKIDLIALVPHEVCLMKQMH